MEIELKLKEQGKISRLTNRTFQFDDKVASNFYTANYFLKTNEIV